MASLSKDSGGKKRIQFVDPNGKRKAIRLGKMPLSDARTVKHYIESLLVSKTSRQSLHPETAKWLRDIPNTLADRLAHLGLIEPRSGSSTVLGPFLDSYLALRSDIKKATRASYGHTIRNLKAYFGADAVMANITEGDAEEWARWLEVEEKLCSQTARRRCGYAKQFFRHAVKKRLIDQNPFEELKATTSGNPDKYRFITKDMIEWVIDACPDAQWRAIVALARYAGLRCPSEILTLTWDRIDWDRERIKAYSPKTEHHEGGAYREIPLFPELRPYLAELWELAEPGENRVITRYEYNGQNTNLRTQFTKIIRRAGLEPWPKLWQNLRSSRETELVETFPLHVVVKWLGNSEAVAKRHYLQITDEHFRQAVDTAIRAGSDAAQNAAQLTHELPRTPPHKTSKSPVKPDGSGASLNCTDVLVGGTGLEPVTTTASEHPDRPQVSTISRCRGPVYR